MVHDAVAATCAENGFAPTVAMEMGETATLISLVAADAAVALVPASAQLMTVGGAVYRPLLGTAHPVQIAMAWRVSDERPLLAKMQRVLRGELSRRRNGLSRSDLGEENNLGGMIF